MRIRKWYIDAGMKQSRLHSESGSCPDAWQEAQQYGIDMSALLANLDKTVLERIRNHDRAMAMALTLRQAMADRHERLRESADTFD